MLLSQLFNTVKYSLFRAFWRVSRTNETASPAVSYDYEFAEKHPGAKSALARWYTIMRKAVFRISRNCARLFLTPTRFKNSRCLILAATKFDWSAQYIKIETRFTFAAS